MGMHVGGGGAEVWSSLLLLCAFLGSNTSGTEVKGKEMGKQWSFIAGRRCW